MLMQDYGGGGGGWPCDDISNFFLQCEIVLKQKATNNYLLYIFAITIASIHIHGFSQDLSPAVSLKLMFFFYLYRCFIYLYLCEQLLRQHDFFKQLLVRNGLIFNL